MLLTPLSHLFTARSYLVLRRRLRAAARWINKIYGSHWTIVEISAGRASLRPSLKDCRYIRLGEEAAELPQADLVVFLGLADRLSRDELSILLGRVPSKRILFSFTEEAGRRRRGRLEPSRRREKEMTDLLLEHGYRRSEVRPLRFPRRDRIVLAERSSF